MNIKMASYAKINLGLKILNNYKSKNFLHEVEIVTQSVDLCDYVSVSNSENLGINLTCNKEIGPRDKNTAYIAAKIFLDYIEKDAGINIRLEKNIPMGAGLGGGSSNAAAVILALNEIFNTNFENEILFKIASEVGSDVPLCMKGGTILATGTGEKIENICELKDCIFLIYKPDFCINTKKAYEIYDIQTSNIKNEQKDDRRIFNLLSAIKEGDIDKIFKNTFNDFENVISCNEVGFRLTGSGSAIYKMFSTDSQAQNALKKINYGQKETFLVRPTKYGVKKLENSWD